ncbi:hypothetical protein GGE59_006893, partial [Rhizobium leguminosarum]|nr:hypothetical protein [Rhizobium leguminosarum]
MAADFHYASVRHADDAVARPYGGEPMRDDDNGAAGGDLVHVGYGMARPSEDIEYDVLFLKGKEQSHADFYL